MKNVNQEEVDLSGVLQLPSHPIVGELSEERRIDVQSLEGENNHDETVDPFWS